VSVCAQSSLLSATIERSDMTKEKVIYDSVMTKFDEALKKLEGILSGEDRAMSPRLQLLYSLLLAVRIYGASGNGILGLRGLGIEESIALCEEILSCENLSERTVNIQTYRRITESISLI